MTQNKIYNSCFRHLFKLMYDPLPGKKVVGDGRLVLRTALVAASLQTTSYRLRKSMDYLYTEGYLSDLSIGHGSIMLEFFHPNCFLTHAPAVDKPSEPEFTPLNTAPAGFKVDYKP